VTWDGTFDPGAFGPPGGSLELRNLRGVVSGRLGAAPLAAETLRVEAGRVVSVGAAPAEADVVVAAAGAVAAPGLVDTHCHVVFGDYTPRQHAVGFLESYLHGGVTQVMSASEVHLPAGPATGPGSRPWPWPPSGPGAGSGPAGSRSGAGR
jgi:enamidase